MDPASLRAISEEVTACRACPRLVSWRERTAREKVARFADQDYWGRAVPSLGDPGARILILGLAPAAHGGNRTGRIFTGDRSGDFLFASLHRVGLANQAGSTHPGDGLTLNDVYVSAVVRCAPPGNRPLPEERDRCLPFLEREIDALSHLQVIVTLGGFAWDGALRTLERRGLQVRPKPRFGHGREESIGPIRLLGCYHPSQQNTFTGRLSAAMMDAVVQRARELVR